MTSEFIRDELFFPLKTRRSGGSGIGAFQAREFDQRSWRRTCRNQSTRGTGTTMRIRFPQIGHSDPLVSAGEVTGGASG